MKFVIDFLPLFGVLGLIFVLIKYNWIAKQEIGSEKMAKIADYIAKGAMSFLRARLQNK